MFFIIVFVNKDSEGFNAQKVMIISMNFTSVQPCRTDVDLSQTSEQIKQNWSDAKQEFFFNRVWDTEIPRRLAAEQISAQNSLETFCFLLGWPVLCSCPTLHWPVLIFESNLLQYATRIPALVLVIFILCSMS